MAILNDNACGKGIFYGSCRQAVRGGHRKFCRRKSARPRQCHYKRSIILLDMNWNHLAEITEYCELFLFTSRSRQRVS